MVGSDAVIQVLSIKSFLDMDTHIGDLHSLIVGACIRYLS